MAKTIIVANWKMHCDPHEASLLVHRLNEAIDHHANTTVVLCPPFIDLYSVAKDMDHKKFKLGSQNLHAVDEGAFTGEVSAAMLKGLVEYSIVGHSERRKLPPDGPGEGDKVIAKKVAAALRNNITPVLCVGDRLLDREHGAARKVVIDQLSAGLSMVTADEIKDIIVTYEPVWAISAGDGRGNFAKPDEVAPMVAAIRHTVEELYGEGAETEVRVLYGGSVNSDNAKAYLEMDGIDGLLPGGASLIYTEFSTIVQAAQATART